MPPHPSQVEPLKRLMKIVSAFLIRPDVGPFREPVDWRGLGLDDYPTIVKKMMDLGTIKRKLERKQYYTATECANDFRLIWANCMAYNADGSDFWLLAKSFARRFEDRYRKIRQESKIFFLFVLCVLSLIGYHLVSFFTCGGHYKLVFLWLCVLF